MADIFTFIEHRGSIQGATVAWIGDSNNVCNTWLQAAEVFDFNVHVSTPPGYEVEPERAGCHGTRHYEQFTDPMEAAQGADLVTTDVWTSMGFEAEGEERRRDFHDWQVDAEMMRATVDALDDGISRALQLVVETAGGQTAKHGSGTLGFKHEGGWIDVATATRHRSVKPPDNVAAFAKQAQPCLSVVGQDKASIAVTLRKPEPFQLAQPSDLLLTERIGLGHQGPPNVHHSVPASGFARERLIQLRPPVGLDLALEVAANFQVSARSEFFGSEHCRAVA